MRIGLDKAERLKAVAQGLAPEHEVRLIVGRNGVAAELDRIARAVRQLVVLEFELLGLFPAPDRDAPPKENARLERKPEQRRVPDGVLDLQNRKDRSDYDRGPLDQVVAKVRKALDADTPADDPFEPPPERKPPSPRAAPQPTTPSPAPVPRKPAMSTKRETPEPAAPAVKRAVPAAEPARPLNRRERRRAERRLRQGRGPP